MVCFGLVEAFEAYILCDVCVHHAVMSLNIEFLAFTNSGLELFLYFAMHIEHVGANTKIGTSTWGWHVGVKITIVFLMLMKLSC